ncbi:MAG TPA: hypothetical protein VF899_15245 [Pyrinomonadaceae bacterium]
MTEMIGARNFAALKAAALARHDFFLGPASQPTLISVSDEKHNAQSKVVEMLPPGIRRAVRYVNGRFWTRGEMARLVSD